MNAAFGDPRRVCRVYGVVERHRPRSAAMLLRLMQTHYSVKRSPTAIEQQPGTVRFASLDASADLLQGLYIHHKVLSQQRWALKDSKVSSLEFRSNTDTRFWGVRGRNTTNGLPLLIVGIVLPVEPPICKRRCGAAWQCRAEGTPVGCLNKV